MTMLKIYDARAKVITEAVKKFGVTALPREFNPKALGNVTPRYSWQIDPSKLKITGTGSDAEAGGYPADRDREHGCWRQRNARAGSERSGQRAS